jgi:hypothetical protein
MHKTFYNAASKFSLTTLGEMRQNSFLWLWLPDRMQIHGDRNNPEIVNTIS